MARAVVLRKVGVVIPMSETVVRGDRESVDSTPNPGESEKTLSGIPRLVYLILNDEGMTSRFCRIIRNAGVSAAIVVWPLAALAYTGMVDVSTVWKYIVGFGSTILISGGSWALGSRRFTRSRRSQQEVSANRQEVNDPGSGEGNDPA
jgi:hypothetical protein